MPDYLKANVEHHDKAFKKGYGILFPEGHVIRVYERILKYELGLAGDKGENFLDFGGGSGTHSGYFASKGFRVYGVDADKTAIERCQMTFPEIAEHFKAVPAKPDPKASFFGVQFDVILANQVLYYFSDSDLALCLDSLFNQLKPGGVLIATMMAKSHYFSKHVKETQNEMQRVVLSGRTKADSWINFTDSREDAIQKFSKFKPLHVGYYDNVIREDEGSSLHYLFVGRKAVK